ncbi:MAG: ABC transporter permease [Candidatus Chisholmbacteria bacterium]|nr:ABC transporter permease [Candidatus Chisholmbacteria bacterium]
MKWHRVVAVMVRHVYNFGHSWDKIADAFYWPAIDILLWGLTSRYMVEQGGTLPSVVVILLSGLVYWQIVWRSQYEITTNLLEELWSHNLVNLFATPLKLREWLVSVLALGMLKMGVTLGFASLLAWGLYAVNIYATGWWFVPLLGLLIMTGWWVGFIVSGLIIRFGTRIQTLAWAGVYILAPFSGIFYPISVLPEWAQTVAAVIPTSHVFEGMRAILLGGSWPMKEVGVSLGLNVVYLLLSMWWFGWLFNQRKERGLAQLE